MAEPYYRDEDVTLHLGDCLDVLRAMEAASVDAVVTDPPYGLEFMGRDWDSFKASSVGRGVRVAAERRDEMTPVGEGHSTSAGPYLAARVDSIRVAGGPFQAWCEAWATECLRVLKPGGWLLAFGGTRTWHRLVCGIEDAGFEVRDAVADLTGYDAAGLLWLYGSGFPKSLDVSKAIDRRRHDGAAISAVAGRLRDALATSGRSRREIDDYFGTANVSQYWFSPDRNAQVPPVERWPWLRSFLAIEDPELDAEVWRLNGRKGEPDEAWKTAEVLRSEDRFNEPSGLVHVGQGDRQAVTRQIKAANSEDAARWEGWGTALKPGWEPIACARKPLGGTVAGNVLEYGTGALNIDGCRVAHASDADRAESEGKNRHADFGSPARDNHVFGADERPRADQGNYDGSAGRWPPNVVLGPAAAAELDRQSGVSTSAGGSRGAGGQHGAFSPIAAQPDFKPGLGDTGGASRFFPVFRYEAKAAAHERPRAEDGTAHPTVKPVDLMRWLVRLVTPPGGLVLDLFAGSGTTAEACIVEGFRCVLAEKDPASAELIKTRLRKPIQPTLA